MDSCLKIANDAYLCNVSLKRLNVFTARIRRELIHLVRMYSADHTIWSELQDWNMFFGVRQEFSNIFSKIYMVQFEFHTPYCTKSITWTTCSLY
jgi:hypothetical protein